MQTATIQAASQGGLKAAKDSKSGAKCGKNQQDSSFDDVLKDLSSNGETAGQIQMILAAMGFNADYSQLSQLIAQNNAAQSGTQQNASQQSGTELAGSAQCITQADGMSQISLAGLSFLSKLATSDNVGQAGNSEIAEASAETKAAPFTLPVQGSDTKASTAALDSGITDLPPAAANDTAGKTAASIQTAQTDTQVTVQVNLKNTAPVQTAVNTPIKQADIQPKDLQTDSAQPVSNIQAVQTAVSAEGSANSSERNSSQSDNSSEQKSNLGTEAAQTYAAVSHTKTFDIKDTAAAPGSEKASVAQQMSDAVKQAVQNGHSEVRIHLSPEDLGGINIKIVSHGGELTLQITADNAKTGQMIASSMNELNQSMKDSGVNMSKADVLFSDSGSFGAASDFQQQTRQQGENFKMPKWTPAMDSVQAQTASEVSPAELSSPAGMSILA